MALMYGIVFLGHQVGSFIGVWLGGWLYDRTGSYDAVWWLGGVLGIMPRSFIGPLKKTRSGNLLLANFEDQKIAVLQP